MDGRKQWTRAGIAHFAAFIGRPASNLFLDPVQRCDALDRFGCDRRLVRFLQVVELAPDMRPTCRFLHTAALIDLVETSIAIGLQNAGELREMLLRVLAFAI